jgi:RNA polymerase sigma factor (sigma-70 family)
MKVLKNNEQVEYWNKFILDGNLDSLSQVYFHYYDQLFTYGLKLTLDKQVVEDTIQNVFLNFVKFRKNIGDVKNLTGYLVSTFRRQLFLDINSQSKTVLTGQIPEGQFDYFKSPDDEILEKENLERLHLTIRECIGKLTAKQQEIIFLRFESGISYEEISAMLDISVESCYKSVYRSVKLIRSEAEKILGKGGNTFFWFWSGLVHKALKYKLKNELHKTRE